MNTLVQYVGVRRDNNHVVNCVILYTQSQVYEIEHIGEDVRLLQQVAHGVLPVPRTVTAFHFTDGESSLIFHVECGYSNYTFEYIKTDDDPYLIPFLTRVHGATTGYGPAGESKQPAQLRL